MNEYMHDWPENKIIFQTERLEISCPDDRITFKSSILANVKIIYNMSGIIWQMYFFCLTPIYYVMIYTLSF